MKLLNRLLAYVALLMVGIIPTMAQTTPPTAPTYDGNAFSTITEVAGDGLLFFLFLMAGMVIITGFFVARKMFRRVV